MTIGPWLKKAKAHVMPSWTNRLTMEKEYAVVEPSGDFTAVGFKTIICHTVMMNIVMVKMNTTP